MINIDEIYFCPHTLEFVLNERNKKKKNVLSMLFKVFIARLTGPFFLVVSSVKILLLANTIHKYHVFKDIFQKKN